jgi:hypothetical protein
MAIVTAACISFGPPQARAASTGADTKTAVACSHPTYPMPTAWYFPAAAPLALVWMQHGFVEDKNVWSALARELATRGYLVMATTLAAFNIFDCTVENLGNNTAFLDNIANVFGKKGDPNGALATSFNTAAAQGGWPRRHCPRSWCSSAIRPGWKLALTVTVADPEGLVAALKGGT